MVLPWLDTHTKRYEYILCDTIDARRASTFAYMDSTKSHSAIGLSQLSTGKLARTKWQKNNSMIYACRRGNQRSIAMAWHATIFHKYSFWIWNEPGCNPVWRLNYGKNARHFCETNYHLLLCDVVEWFLGG